MPSAPHLPPPSSSLAMHYRLQSLPWMLFILFVSALTSFTTTLVVLVYLAPATTSEQTLYSFINRANEPTLDPGIIVQAKERLVTVYQKKQKLNNAFYAKDAIIGTAAVLSGDGWAVMVRTPYTPGEENGWEGIDERGLTFPVSLVIPDQVSGLVYVRFKANGLRIMPLNTNDGSQTMFVQGDNGWKTVLAHTVRETQRQLSPIWQPIFFERFLSEITPGSIVLSDRGDLVGFVSPDNTLIPAWLVGHNIASILEHGRIEYAGLPFEGYPVAGVNTANGSLQVVTGWYVEKSSGRSTSSTVGKGDVLTRVNGQHVSEDTDLARLIITGPDAIPVTVIRRNMFMDMVLPRSLVIPKKSQTTGKSP